MSSHSRSNSFITSLEDNIETLELERQNCLSKLRAIDAELQRQKLFCAQTINKSAHISALPNEILAMIFEAGWVSDVGGEGLPLEMLVSQTSTSFRRIAMAAPRLWTRIHRSLRGSPLDELALSAYLLRSGAMALDFHIDVQCEGDVELLGRLLIPQAWRWNSLSVMCEGHATEMLTLLSCIVAPRLRYLQIQGPLPDDVEFGEVYPEAPLGCMRMREMWVPEFLVPFHSTITSFYIDRLEPKISFTELCYTLEQLKGLNRLMITGGDNFDLPVGHVPTVVLPRLIYLYIGLHPCRSLRRDDSVILSAVNTPMLKDLVLENVSCNELAQFYASLASSPKFPSLRSLTVGQDTKAPYSRDDWKGLSRAFPTITHLVVLCATINEVLAVLNPHVVDEGHAQWACLKTLSLGSNMELIPVPPPIDARMLCDMVAARANAGYSLTRLVMSEEIMSLASVQDRLEWLRGGLQVGTCEIQCAEWEDIVDGLDVDDEWNAKQPCVPIWLYKI